MPNNWKKYKLEEIVTLLGDGLHGTPKYSNDGEYYFINGNNLQNGKIEFKNDTKKVNKEEFEKYKKNLTDRTLMVSINGTIGNVAFYNNEKIILGKSACYFNLKNDVDKNFIKQVISSNYFKDYLLTNATGTTIQNVSLKSMRDFPITLPPLPEQEAIAEILSSLDDKIELNLQTNKTLEEMANALYKHWFVDFGPFKDGKFVESELGMIPEDWEVANLGDVVDIGSSKRIFLNEYVSSGIPFYRGKEIIELSKNNSINNELFIENEKFEEIKVKFGAPKEGDILLTSVGTIGKSYLVGANETFYFKDGNLTWIKNYISYLKPHFIFQWLNSNETSEQIQSIKIGSTQEAITIQGIRGLKIVVPPKLVHDQVEINIREYRNLIKANNLENEAIKQTRDYLLPKLISGEIRVKEAELKVKKLL
jgi:type I restriction enzyme S subunit